MKNFDVAIIGAGIAGASIASEIAGDCSVLLLEAEDQPGYHATGRSAAFWTETYGGPYVQPLTTASETFLSNPTVDFSDRPFLSPRGAINIGRQEDLALAQEFVGEFEDTRVAMEFWNEAQLKEAIPGLRAEWRHGVFEPDCCDIDVASLHHAYLRDTRRKGCQLERNARVHELEYADRSWDITAGDNKYAARILVNAAGAWVDEIALLAGVTPIGIKPMRRTLVQVETDPPSSPGDRLVIALDGSFYFKPEAGGSYWLSPHDEIADVPRDVAPEEIDVAIAIDRFQSAIDVVVKSVTRKWAGLRSFAPDRLPVYGFDPAQPAFFWCAGQGGFGIQTAPAAAKICKAILLNETPEDSVRNIDAALYEPARFS